MRRYGKAKMLENMKNERRFLNLTFLYNCENISVKVNPGLKI